MPGQSGQGSSHEYSPSPSPYASPVLSMLDEEDKPQPLPACGGCPAAVWYHTSQTLKCFCRVMHNLTWGGEEKPVMLCDARAPEIRSLRQRIADEKQARG